MRTQSLILATALSMSLPALAHADDQLSVTSPDGHIQVHVMLEKGVPEYSVDYDGKPVVSDSKLGFRFAKAPDMEAGFTGISGNKSESDTTWEQPWGERHFIRDHHKELLVHFTTKDKPDHKFDLRVKVFNTGLGFRYEVPGKGERKIVDELTEFVLPDIKTSWWIPGGGWNRHEYLYQNTPLSEVVQADTPITFERNDGVYMAIHEAALVNYSGMWLDQRRPGHLEADLAPAPDGGKVTVEGDFKTPWRTIQIAPRAVGLVNSDIILNLNEPNKLGDVGWVHPGKYVGIWWCMHIGLCTWGRDGVHGATTERTKKYIDFAAGNGFSGVLVEGWNTGWDGDWFHNGDVFSFTQTYPDYNLKGLAEYARKKGVRLIAHNETSGSLSNYEKQIPAAYKLYESLGIEQIKTGYVADGGDLTWTDTDGKKVHGWHDGQRAVQHELYVQKLAAKHHLSIDTHEPVKDTGLRRTYPNWLSREGARGQEYNAWGHPPNPPEHQTMLPFTRMLSGPFDFTPGIFDLTPNKPGSPNAKSRPETTLIKQLAEYVTIYSPVQMAADLPENYGKYPKAFDFIKQVPTDWEQSIALQGEVGDDFVMARQRRGGDDWFLGAVTDENERILHIPLSFLKPDVTYEARIWRDGEGANWKTNPYACVYQTKQVSSKDTLDIWLASSGGAAMRFIPVTDK